MAIDVCHPARKQRNFDIFQNREPREQCEALKNDSDIRVRFSQWVAVPEHLAVGGRRKSSENSQERGFARAGRPQQRSDHARFDAQIHAGDYLRLSSVRAIECFLDLARFDDGFESRRFRRDFQRRLNRRSDDLRGCWFYCLLRKFVHHPLPGFLRELVEKVHAFAGVHSVDNRAHVLDRQRVQQNVGVVIGKDAGQLSGEIDRQFVEQRLLLFERKAHQQISGAFRIKTLEQRHGLFPMRLRKQLSKLVGSQNAHILLCSSGQCDHEIRKRRYDRYRQSSHRRNHSHFRSLD